MRIVTGLYTISTFVIASIFLAAYYYSGEEFCLLPVCLVLFDYIRAIRNTARRIPDRPVIPRQRYVRDLVRDIHTQHDMQMGIVYPKEFIQEEEFKV